MTPPSATVVVVGNPNSGKTTLFNALTGGHQRVGNWPGVTVERKEGRGSIGGRTVTLVDLPGIYALLASSEDERVARDELLSGEPDLIVDVVDAMNLERNLYLTTQLLDLRIPVVVVLTMMDRAAKRGIAIDVERLAARLGCPVVAVDATRRAETVRALDDLAGVFSAPGRTAPVAARPAAVEAAAARWAGELDVLGRRHGGDGRWLARKVLERDAWATALVVEHGVLAPDAIEAAIAALESELGEPADLAIAEARYGSITAIAAATVTRPPARPTLGERLDRVVLHRILGIPIFLVVMAVVFWLGIGLGGAFVDVFDGAGGALFVDAPAALLRAVHAPEAVTTILAYGVGAGLRTVATFVPIIFLMFAGLATLEESGYLARGAFVVDRLMRAIGLPGSAFVPLLIGFGCNVPAILATRTLEGRRDRAVTIFMNPFISCGARLPVYALFGAAFFGAAAGAVTFSLYVVGIVVAILTGLLLKATLFRGASSSFLIELPAYHRPRPRSLVRQATRRLAVFVTRARLIVPIVAILAVLNSLGTDGTFGNQDTPRSVLAGIGRTITPVFEPMGVEPDNWPATVGILTGVLAKETVVGTLSGMYGQNGAGTAGGADTATTAPGTVDGLRRGFGDPAHAYAYLLFVLLYVPCVATFAAMARELGRRDALLAVLHVGVTAWSVATLFFQLAVGHDVRWIALAGGLLGGMALLFLAIGERDRGRERAGAAVALVGGRRRPAVG